MLQSNNKTIVLEWKLPWGAGGMAAQMARARLQGQLNRIAKQHKFHVELYTTDDRYRIRADFTEQQYVILCLQWQIRDSWDKWRVTSKFVL